MSVEMMSQCWKLDLPQNKKLVLLAIADHANDEGIAWPSQGRIAWKTGYKRRNIKYILDSLVEDGYLTILRIGNGRKNSTVHQLTLENAPRLPEYNADDYYVPFKERVQPDVKGATGGKRVQPVVEKGAIAVAPEPSLEPSIEPSVGNEEKASSLPGGGKASDSGFPKPKTAHQEMFDALIEACNVVDVTPKFRGWANRSIKKLLASGISPPDILDFNAYWNSDDWRSQNTKIVYTAFNPKFDAWLSQGKPSNNGGAQRGQAEAGPPSVSDVILIEPDFVTGKPLGDNDA